EVGEVHAAVSGAGLEVIECLRGAVEVEDGLEAIARPLDAGDALRLGAARLGVTPGESADVVDEHGVEDAVLVLLLRAVAGIEVAGYALVLEDDGPGNGGRIAGKEGIAGRKGERLHISHDTIKQGPRLGLRT